MSDVNCVFICKRLQLHLCHLLVFQSMCNLQILYNPLIFQCKSLKTGTFPSVKLMQQNIFQSEGLPQYFGKILEIRIANVCKE